MLNGMSVFLLCRLMGPCSQGYAFQATGACLCGLSSIIWTCVDWFGWHPNGLDGGSIDVALEDQS